MNHDPILTTSIVFIAGCALIMLYQHLKRAKTSKRVPMIGASYESEMSNRDPFPSNCRHTVEVLDVESGWVRYKFNNSERWQDERLCLSSFNYIYPCKVTRQ